MPQTVDVDWDSEVPLRVTTIGDNGAATTTEYKLLALIVSSGRERSGAHYMAAIRRPESGTSSAFASCCLTTKVK